MIDFGVHNAYFSLTFQIPERPGSSINFKLMLNEKTMTFAIYIYDGIDAKYRCATEMFSRKENGQELNRISVLVFDGPLVERVPLCETNQKMVESLIRSVADQERTREGLDTESAFFRWANFNPDSSVVKMLRSFVIHD